MQGDFRPKILRGALLEFGLSLPPLIVVFQYNPEQLTRSRNLSFAAPSNHEGSLRTFHKDTEDLTDVQKCQEVTVEEESINFEIKLDASEDLDKDDLITREFGLSPQLSTLELMTVPKDESLLGAALGALLGGEDKSFSFTKGGNPPMILLIFGRKRVLPVNINSMTVTETHFNTTLNPIKASVSLNMTVIEGKNLAFMYSKAMKEVMSVLNLANIGDVASVMIPS